MKYRAEIDGLRAFAVIPVILFHAGFAGFSGGFVGVDVFFVISGYLITCLILSDMNNNKFSLVEFYERRARRILPALFFVMFCCLPFAWFWLLPSHLEDFSRSLTAVSFFYSNFLFWQESGYFENASELKPLLHTWSLAVEEQYYIIFPLVLMALWRLRKQWVFVTLVITALLSFALAQWGAYNHPSATFFLIVTRAWELMIGALVAFYFVYRPQHLDRMRSCQKISEIMGAIGLLLICYSVVIFDETIPFPSFYALIPTLGAALIIIFAHKETWVGRLLSIKPIVGIGLISYSAYLWHQPILVFAKHRLLEEPSVILTLILCVASIMLAYLSWRYVESPFRNKKAVSRKFVFTFALIGTIFFAAVGLMGDATDGFDKRTNKNGILLSDFAEKMKSNQGLSKECEGSFTLSKNCRTSDTPEILLWGDSYAMHLAQGIVASNPDVKMIQMTKSVCGPLFDVAPVNAQFTVDWAKGCLDFNNKVKEWLRSNKTVQYVVMSSPFALYLGGAELFDGTDFYSAGQEIAVRYLVQTLDDIKNMGITPVIISPPPKNGKNMGECLVRHQYYGHDLSACDFLVKDLSSGSQYADDFLSQVPERYKVIFLKDEICQGDWCRASFDETFIYRDTGHLSYEGAALIGEKMKFYDEITGK